MTQVLTTEQIAARPEVVWAYISNLPRIPEWVVGTKQMLSISTKQAELGTAYRELSQVGPMTAQTNWQITAFSAPSVQTHECRGPLFNAVLTMTLEPQGTGTRFKHLLDVQMLPGIPLLGQLLAWMLRPSARRDMRHSLQKAKQIIEHEHCGTGCNRT